MSLERMNVGPAHKDTLCTYQALVGSLFIMAWKQELPEYFGNITWAKCCLIRLLAGLKYQ